MEYEINHLYSYLPAEYFESQVKTKDEFCCEMCDVRHHDCSRISIIYPLSNFFDIFTSVSWEFLWLPFWFTLMVTTRLTTFF